MQVLKFGGSSVANAGAMLRVIDIVKKALETDRTLVVSSAISGCTDELIALGRRMAEAYGQSQVGTVRRVLFETCEESKSVGYTLEYMRCEAEGALCGESREVLLTKFEKDCFTGKIIL